MKRSLKDKVTWYFIHMGRKGRLFRIPAMTGLAACLMVCRLADYFKKNTKRFACTIFILLCFMVGNSFAFPVFQDSDKGGFVSEGVVKTEIAAASESDIVLVREEEVSLLEMELLEDADVLAGCSDAELHGAEEADKYSLDEILEENADILEEAESTEKEDDDRESEIAFSADDWKLVLINKQHPIPEDYTFTLGNIKTIKGDMQCDERIVEDLLSMMQAASQDSVNLAICSPYRDLKRQEVLFNRKIEAYMKKGMSYMEAYKISSQAVTVPGASEHQIGLAVDIISNDYITLDEGFADTNAGKWLAEHSCEYGFILRYPEGKEYITSIEFEPWHFRYVGKEAATVITKEGLTLEEFWDKYL